LKRAKARWLQLIEPAERQTIADAVIKLMGHPQLKQRKVAIKSRDGG
jgi:hypothetical protein